jgi:hypothetical protein
LPAGTAGQLIAGAGAVVALLSPLTVVLAAAGTGLLVLGVVLAAPAARLRGPFIGEWWTPLALASLVCLAGFAAEIFLPVIGGILLTGGAVAALIVLGLSTPPQAPVASARRDD